MSDFLFVESFKKRLIRKVMVLRVPLEELIGLKGEQRLSKIGMEQMLVSMGHQSSGAIKLWNYPSWMRDLVPHDIHGADRPDPVDMATLESNFPHDVLMVISICNILILTGNSALVCLVYRDRERKVTRYNEFRRNMLMIPIGKWEDLTDNEEVVEALREVYGDDVEKLDLLVGLHAEKKIKGFAISETSFFLFLLIASRYILLVPISASLQLKILFSRIDWYK